MILINRAFCLLRGSRLKHGGLPHARIGTSASTGTCAAGNSRPTTDLSRLHPWLRGAHRDDPGDPQEQKIHRQEGTAHPLRMPLPCRAVPGKTVAQISQPSSPRRAKVRLPVETNPTGLTGNLGGLAMKKFLLGSVGLAAMLAGPAMAADMRVAPPPPPVVYYDWSGAYVGGNIGGVWYQQNQHFLAPNAAVH